MKNNLATRTIVTLLATSLATAACDKSGRGAQSSTDTAPKQVGLIGMGPKDLIARIGASPGPVQQDKGAAAVLLTASGKLEIRPLGEETFRVAVTDQLLYPGDQLRTAEGAQATLLFADESVGQLAEETTLEVGTRVVTPDPASTAAVLSGVGRFSVKPRAPAEGPFIVFTPAGLVTSKGTTFGGTTFGVGVAANGEARVGVEDGSVEVAGAAALGAPASVEADHVLSVNAAGAVGAATTWAEDDWGTWRDGAEARLSASTTLAAHGTAMAELEAQLDAAYASLEALAIQVSEFEAQAAADAKAEASVAYAAKLPAAQIAIDASYLAALRLEWLTRAHEARALLATELYVRNPELKAWAKVESHVYAAVLWPKRFDLMAVTYLEPLRVQYYVHHARGRARAELVGIAVPAFYAQVTPPQVPIAEARAKFKFAVYAAPELSAVASGRALWVFAPRVGWHKKLKVEAAAPRTALGFWVRPPKLRSKVILGVKARAQLKPAFGVIAPSARGELKLQGKVKLALGEHIRVPAPNLRAGAKARAAFHGEYAMPSVALDVGKAEFAANAQAKGAAKLSAASKAQASAKAKISAAHQGSAKTAAKVRGDLKAGAHAAAGAKASAKLQVKAPKVEITPPKVAASAKGSASFKLGN